MNVVETVIMMECLSLAGRRYVMYILCVQAELFKHYLNGGCVPGDSNAEVRHRDTD